MHVYTHTHKLHAGRVYCQLGEEDNTDGLIIMNNCFIGSLHFTLLWGSSATLSSGNPKHTVELQFGQTAKNTTSKKGLNGKNKVFILNSKIWAR